MSMDIKRAAAVGALAAIAALGTAAAGTAPPSPPDLEIAVSNGQSGARTGDRLDYTIKVQNNEPKPVPATVRVELPGGMTFVSGDKGAKADGPAVSWRSQLAPAKSTELRFTAELADRAPSTQVKAMAATACALAAGQPRPVVCATDIDPLSEGSMMAGAGGTTMVVGIAILALGAGGAAWWLLRRRRGLAQPSPAGEEPRVPTPS